MSWLRIKAERTRFALSGRIMWGFVRYGPWTPENKKEKTNKRRSQGEYPNRWRKSSRLTLKYANAWLLGMHMLLHADQKQK